MSKFSEIIPYPFFAEEHDDFARVRESGRSNDEIAFAYLQNRSYVAGFIKDLTPKYDTLRFILQYTLAPKAGDSHMLQSTTIDLFVYAK